MARSALALPYVPRDGVDAGRVACARLDDPAGTATFIIVAVYAPVTQQDMKSHANTENEESLARIKQMCRNIV